MDSHEIRIQLKKMIELQRVEMEALKVRSMLENVGQKLSSLELERQAFENELKEQEVGLAEMKKAYKSYELDAQSHLSKMNKSRDKLHSVKTNKEYQSILKEIDEMKSKNSELEDLMLAHLDDIEAAEAALKKKRADFTVIEHDLRQRTREIMDDEAQRRIRLGELEAERDGIFSDIKPDYMDKLKFVRSNVGVLAVAPAIRAVCQGCHMNIPPQLFNEIQRFDNIYYCPNCQRIIFWEKPEE